LSSYFSQRFDTAFSVLFGSLSRGTSGPISDIDVAVYFYPREEELEIEEEVYYVGEDEIWAHIDHISGIETDLLVMNRAPARLVYAALSEGTVLHISDRALFLRVMLATGRLSEEYEAFSESFFQIKARSTSLSGVDRDRLLRILDVLETELEDVKDFTEMSYEEYLKDSGKGETWSVG
jgi:predicted nucleotidyltransferase